MKLLSVILVLPLLLMMSWGGITYMPRHQSKDLTNQKFGRLTALSVFRVGGRVYWRCECECGNKSNVLQFQLINGHSQSCGCLHKEKASSANLTHGGYRTSEYRIWASMIQRCENPKEAQFKDYGGRGIKVHPSWKDFAVFIKDVGPKPTPTHSIDRFPNMNGNYEPGNVRWATRKEQNRNARFNRNLTFNGKTQCASAWAEDLGVPVSRILTRLRRGWTVERTLTA